MFLLSISNPKVPTKRGHPGIVQRQTLQSHSFLVCKKSSLILLEGIVMTLIMSNALGININTVCNSTGVQNKSSQIPCEHSPIQRKSGQSLRTQLSWRNVLIWKELIEHNPCTPDVGVGVVSARDNRHFSLCQSWCIEANKIRSLLISQVAYSSPLISKTLSLTAQGQTDSQSPTRKLQEDLSPEE